MWNNTDQNGLLPILLCLLIVLPTIYVVYQRVFSPFASTPGPFWASLSRLWIAKHSRDGDLNHVMIDLHKRYGPLVRTGPYEVSVADLTAIKSIYGAGTKFRKSDWYSVWQATRKFDLFGERNESVHAVQRRLVAQTYSMGSLKDLEEFVNGAIKGFMRKMGGFQDSKEPADMGKLVQLFAFDIIGEITFSKTFGFVDAGMDDGTFSSIEGILRSACWLGQIPWIYRLHQTLMPVIGNHLGVNARHGGVRNFAMSEVRSRKDRGSDRKDILSKLFAVNEKKPTEFDLNVVVSMATSNIAAGSDTTAISIRAIIYYLLKNPTHKQRLVDEIDGLRRQGKISDPVSLSQADSMPYLQAVMYEALRVHPAVGMSLPRVVPSGGIDIHGKYFPAGSVVGVNPWVVHRNKEVFGDDADDFRPD
ncbi:cytochrome P450 [Mytilinidion resinicola]|uniref:Cytochrome P450 n=1 Tax=Mytilinidion resinicola TaxID=574789 RepID=A0A6A6YWW9_9PEZI|nr:cytochrome P450 [Mytilinidion resinicola]KAF2813426.1 cytochrome P450 [Mytilinidion resinicola]